MNTLQLIALIVYLLTLTGCLYFFTKRFEKGWFRKVRQGQYSLSNKGHIDFRIICLVIVLVFVFIIKWAGVH